MEDMVDEFHYIHCKLHSNIMENIVNKPNTKVAYLFVNISKNKIIDLHWDPQVAITYSLHYYRNLRFTREVRIAHKYFLVDRYYFFEYFF